MPEIFADQHRRPAPARIERGDLRSRFDESLLLKYAISRQEDLAMNVHEPRTFRAEFGVQRRVVDVLIVFLIETDHRVNRPAGTGSARPGLGQMIEHLPGGDGMLAHASLEEVSGRGGFREHDEIRSRREAVQSSETVGDAVQAGGRISLVGTKLREREMEVHFDSERLGTGGGCQPAHGPRRVLMFNQRFREGAAVEFSQIALGTAFIVVIGLPVLAVRGGVPDDQAAEVARARRTVYASAALSLLVLSAMAFGVAVWQGITPARLGWRVGAPGPALLWAAGIAVSGLFVALVVSRVGVRLGWRESPVSIALMPRNGKEIRSFLLMVGIAAVGEEYLFRGFAYQILAEPLGAWPAVLVTSVSFGLSHGYQRAIGIVRASCLGLLLSLPVLWTGSLFPAIVAHFWINAAIGIGGWRYFFQSVDESREENG